jgi:D-glycero-D-manno-heptose 1,7-bisphosphate phosphatase
MSWAVFLDRDGTLNEDAGYLHDPARLVLFPGVADAVRRLNEAGIPVFLVTNQSGIGRGYYAAEDMEALHLELARLLAAAGAQLDDIYHCPHTPDAGCPCRKPAPGLLLQAAADHGLDLAASFMIGDKLSDLQAGERAGCRVILVLTGDGRRTQEDVRRMALSPDFVAEDLSEAASWILGQTGDVP